MLIVCGMSTFPEEGFGQFGQACEGCITRYMQPAALLLSSVILSKYLNRNITELLAVHETTLERKERPAERRQGVGARGQGPGEHSTDGARRQD